MSITYQQAKRIRKTGVMSLFADQLMYEKKVTTAIKKTISLKTRGKIMGVTQYLDPLNIAKMFGGRMGVGIMGNLTSRSSADMQHFGGKSKKAPKIGSVDAAFYTNVAATEKPRLRKGDNAPDVAIKIYSIMKKDSDDKKLRMELENDRHDDQFSKIGRAHV